MVGAKGTGARMTVRRLGALALAAGAMSLLSHCKLFPWSCGCTTEVGPQYPVGPSCPLTDGDAMNYVVGISTPCLTCLDNRDQAFTASSYYYGNSDVGDFWSCYCSCPFSDTNCQIQCHTRLGVSSAESLNAALDQCATSCAGESIAPVAIAADASAYGPRRVACYGSVYTTVNDNRCGCDGGASYAVCVDGRYDCGCAIPHGYVEASMCVDGRDLPDAGPPPLSLLLFGGCGGGDTCDELGDTWTWDGTVWSQVFVVGPSPRDSAVMASLGDSLVLFGGENAASDLLNDAWVWDGACWSTAAHAKPWPREGAAFAEADGRGLLFGGYRLAHNGNETETLADTWTWNGRTWTALSVKGPSARSASAMATTPSGAVLFGGDDTRHAALGDTWTWDGSAWMKREVKGPGARDSAATATLGGTVVLFGGEDAKGHALGDTWTWNGKAWTQQEGKGPPARASASMATFEGVVVLFGGWDAKGRILGDTWTWDGSRWTERKVEGPPARSGASMASFGRPGKVDAGVDAGVDAAVEGGVVADAGADGVEAGPKGGDAGRAMDAGDARGTADAALDATVRADAGSGRGDATLRQDGSRRADGAPAG